MDVSLYKTALPEKNKLVSALPKVNVRPTDSAPPPKVARKAAASPEKPSSATASVLPRRKDWDIRFAIGLILVVVLVNVSLTLLFGGANTDQTEEAAIILQQPDPQRKTGENTPRTTNVYISSDEKRLLLRHLYTPAENVPPGGSSPTTGESGTYRSLSNDQERGLSIIGTTPSAGQ